MTFELIPHPMHPPTIPMQVSASVRRGFLGLQLEYQLHCELSRVRLPAPSKPYRTGGLWKSTCFEIFIGGETTAYCEFNLAPSAQWAAYQFDDYRGGMTELGVEEPPYINWVEEEGRWGCLTARLHPVQSPSGACFGLSAVIEEIGGRKSYWALAHPDGPPDFHNRDCFTARLP